MRLCSDIVLPELAVASDEGETDVEVTATFTDRPIAESAPRRSGHAVHFAVENVAAFHIAGGSQIAINANPAADARNVRLFLLGSALGILLQQRGLVPLHANAVLIDGRAVLFMGGSGEGKSTLADWFLRNGLTVLADDVAAIGSDSTDNPIVWPGLARMRLWDDALKAGGRDRGEFALSFEGDPSWTKFDVPIHRQPMANPVTIGAIYELKAENRLAIKPLAGMAAFDRLAANVYRGRHLGLTDPKAAVLRRCARLAERVPMFIFERPWGFDCFENNALAALDHARTVIGTDGESCPS